MTEDERLLRNAIDKARRRLINTDRRFDGCAACGTPYGQERPGCATCHVREARRARRTAAL